MKKKGHMKKKKNKKELIYMKMMMVKKGQMKRKRNNMKMINNRNHMKTAPTHPNKQKKTKKK